MIQADQTNPQATATTSLVYVGTYTGGGSEGIYLCRLDLTTGALERIGVAAGADNPSYLAIDAARLRLYAVNEVSEYEGRAGGSISAYAIQPASGALSLINRQFSHGKAPCYVTTDRAGRYVFVVNYAGGNGVVLPLGADGALLEPSDIIVHAGGGRNSRRQDGPHPHAIVLDKAGNYAFVPDLGLDRVMQYRFDPRRGRLPANEQPGVDMPPGSGPRHLVFHRNGRQAYVINELSSTIAACAYDPERGTLRVIQTVATLPDGFQGTNLAADIHLTPNGKFLFASNRGHDSIACYPVDPETGELQAANYVSTQGRTPRGFAVDPGGTFVLVANQDSHHVLSFRLDEEAGTISPTGHAIPIPNPTCLKPVQLPRRE